MDRFKTLEFVMDIVHLFFISPLKSPVVVDFPVSVLDSEKQKALLIYPNLLKFIIREL